MTTPDVHALTGAYVLDAVSESERMDFERHLRECETCSQEVNELRETATRLGTAAAAVPPPRLKDSVMARIRQVRQDPPQAPVTPLRRRRRNPWTVRLMSAAAAVLLVAAGVLGVLLVQTQQQAEVSADKVDRMETILRAEDAQVITQVGKEGGVLTLAATRSLNRALLLTDDLPAPPPGQTYQVWKIVGDAQFTSAGTLDGSGATALAMDVLGAADAIGVTLEPEGGSDQPTLEELQAQLLLN